MKKSIIGVLIFAIVSLLFTSCNTNSAVSEYDNARNSVVATTWSDFLEQINNQVLTNEANDTFRKKALNKSIEISEFKITSINYAEYIPMGDITANYWELDIYWDEVNSRNGGKINYSLIYDYNGGGFSSIPKGYSVYDQDNNIYTETLSSGFKSYICLLNDNAYIRFQISSQAEDCDGKVKQFIDYALEIKSFLNEDNVSIK